MRTLHLYTGLFLVPWMIIYAISAFGLNHNRAIVELFNIQPVQWEIIQRADFSPDGDFPRLPAEQARVILQTLGLDGPHFIQGKPTEDGFRVIRFSGAGNYRIQWQRNRGLLVVERQTTFSVYRFIHSLHFRCGYAQPYTAFQAWAVIVDLVALSIFLWVVSGIYLWLRRPRERLTGGIVLAAGMLCFTALVILLCM